MRLLLGLAPQLGGSDELLQLALLKCSDKAKEARAQRRAHVGVG